MTIFDFQTATNQTPQDALKFLEKKDPALTWTSAEFAEWTDQARAESFTIAKVTALNVVQDMLDMVSKATETGMTFYDFKNNVNDMMQSKGWSAEDSKKLTPSRLYLIYQTNLQTAYNAGRVAQQKEVAKARPYWQYNSVVDGSTTDGCKGLNGVTLRYDDPFWNNNYPPRHFHCRASVTTLSERELKRDGIELTNPKDVAKVEPLDGFGGQPDAGYVPDKTKYDAKLFKTFEKLLP